MGKMTLLLCSLAVSGLASYYGLGAFFESSSQLAYDLKSNLLAKHTYMVFLGLFSRSRTSFCHGFRIR